MHTPQSHLVREALMRDPAAGRYVRIAPRELPLESLSLAAAPALLDRRLPRDSRLERRA